MLPKSRLIVHDQDTEHIGLSNARELATNPKRVKALTIYRIQQARQEVIGMEYLLKYRVSYRGTVPVY